MAVLVDSCVLLDILTEDPDWSAWADETIKREAAQARIIMNIIVYAEISNRFSSMEALDKVLANIPIDREPIPYRAAFLAGKSFLEYRRRHGTRTSPLPDFFIGAHAAVAGHRLMTRDVARYKTYFPKVELIAPDAI